MSVIITFYGLIYAGLYNKSYYLWNLIQKFFEGIKATKFDLLRLQRN